MYIKYNSITYSPSDLSRYSVSPFASWMERCVLEQPDFVEQVDDEDSLMGLLAEKGDVHEHAILEQMESEGKYVARIDQTKDKALATMEAMQSGADIIFQAALKKDSFAGFADFLVRVPGESELGDYHYEVWDTKLARAIKPYFVIQLCCYIDMLEEIQQVRAHQFAIVLGNGTIERLNTTDYFYYYQNLKAAFLDQQSQFDINKQPDPFDSTSWGRWNDYANQQLEQRDHLCRVATMSRSQIIKLKVAGIESMTALAESKLDSIHGLRQELFLRLKRQAKIQLASRGQEIPLYEVVLPSGEVPKGLQLLPPHSPMDVYFDIEGFPLDEGGLEYLWGNTYFDEQGERQFIDFWAHNPEQEKQAFKEFIEWVYTRWKADPAMHIYHYANYEIAACRKLMGRYGVCEFEVDELLRNEVFVDLYKLVKGALVIGEPRYSIKNVEHLYRSKRETEVGNGGDSVVVYDNWRQNPDGETWQTSKILNDIRDYNIDDCESTQELVFWLRERQAEHNIQFAGKTEVTETELTEEATEKTLLRDRLLGKAESIREKHPQQATLIENLAWSLEFHRRESKPIFWRLFDRLGLSDMELVEDADCLAACVRTATAAFKPKPRARNLAYEYRFDNSQEFKAVNTNSFYVLGIENEKGNKLTVTHLKDHSDLDNGIIVIQTKHEPPEVITLIPDEYVNPKPIPQALQRVVESLELDSEIDLPRCAIVDFLTRSTPNIKGLSAGEPIAPASVPTERLTQIIQAIVNLDNSYLAIQGPPGAGKTFTGKHVIAELLKRGKRVGICSNSHKAINNLLIGTAEYCQKEGVSGNFACTKDTDPMLEELGIPVIGNKDIESHMEGACVIGTTAWGFAKEELEKSFDYLFIDEAGQVSVANLIAISLSCDNIVLMGDQMQLGQPSQGVHPAESGLSILDYLLHESSTIEEHMGVFLGTTYRMHSKVNQFISDAIYDGKLSSHPDNDHQIIKVPNGYQGEMNQRAGIHYIEVEHEGNSQASTEEVSKIVELTHELLGRVFVDKEGSEREIGWDDLLFVAPYNHQVTYLKSALGEHAKVGSVDKFQGQEAPIVILSMCASNAAESPRGMEFLFDRHRINVAISRAQSLAIVVASSNLVNASVNNLAQQRLVNLMALLKVRFLKYSID